MPELPEVETIRRQLQPNIINKEIAAIEILSKKQFIGHPKDIIGRKIIDIQRYGKVLVLKLSNSQNSYSPHLLFLNIHLKLTGQLLFAKNKNQPVFKEIIPFTKTKKMPANTTRVIIYFDDDSVLFFNDLRKFGWIKISNTPQIPKAIDVLAKEFTLEYLKKIIQVSKKPIKILLMDQDKLAGIGNIYANDSLFLAKIHPERKANSLSLLDINKLYKSIKKIIEQSIKHGGSSGADEAFIKPDGKKGRHQRYFLVYQRENQPCPICKTLIKRIKQGGRSSFFCPKCQN